MCENIRTLCGSPREAQLDGNRDLFLDFLGGAPGVQRDDGDLNVGDVRERLDRQRLEREDAAGDEQHRHQQHEQRLMQRERNDAANHGGPVECAVVGQLLEQSASATTIGWSDSTRESRN